ncbi:hypothetical protein AMTRI_Chr12g239230 [Amborella trichopoda]
MEPYDEDPMSLKLFRAKSDLLDILQASNSMDLSLTKMEMRLTTITQTISTTRRVIAPLQSIAMATKALDTRIDRAISPATKVLETFRIAENLQTKLSKTPNPNPSSTVDPVLKSANPSNPVSDDHLNQILQLLQIIDELHYTLQLLTTDCEPAIQRLQEVVEFLSRTRATDNYRINRLKDALETLKAVYENEIDTMNYDGLLDETLLSLQYDYEKILDQLKLKITEEGDQDRKDLGSELQVEVLRRITETLSVNDCLDICIDIYVKIRYKRAAKALMQLNPDYLKTYAPEDIDLMAWKKLETAISLWIQHFELALKTVFESEKKLCQQVFNNIMEGSMWPECFVKIADKIMAVFFRFGEGVARSSKEPQKLFKLLDMYESTERLKPEVADIFEGEAGIDICARLRELQKLLVHASCKVFYEFGLHVEGLQDGVPPSDGAVTKLIRYSVNYLKTLTSEGYSSAMAKALKTEQIWKSGVLSKPATEESLLKDAIMNVMEAMKRYIDGKKSSYRDRILSWIFSMNAHWYVYMRARNTELGRLLGEPWLREKFKAAAEMAAYSYQENAWGSAVAYLEGEELKEENYNDKGEIEALMRENLKAFLKSFEICYERHKKYGYNVPDVDLREQIKGSIVKLVVPAYEDYKRRYGGVVENVEETKGFPTPGSIERRLGRLFVGKAGG